MKYKPWPIVILAIIHFIEPLTKILFYSVFYKISPVTVVTSEVSAGSALDIFEFFFLFPIAGYAIWSVRKWSIPVFLVIEAWVVIANWSYLNSLYTSGQTTLLICFICFGILNIFVAVYMLIPAVRLAYFDPRIRWWEAKPRYTFKIDCKVNDNDIAEILNISSTGVFIANQDKKETGKTINLKFDSKGQSFSLEGNVVHNFTINGVDGYGVQFQNLDKINRTKVKKLIRTLEDEKVERRPERRNLVEDFKNWLLTAVKTGKGIVPDKGSKG
jgi:hypothetical protein